MDFGVFQLLPRPEGVCEQQVLEQALWEVEFAEREGFDGVWIAEHHGSSFGTIGAPSVYAAAIARMTSRIRIGYAVAVLPLHHPLRLAEEIAWVDRLSGGRVAVGVGPGFRPFEFELLGVPIAERHARFEEGLRILRRELSVPLLRACSSVEAVRRAADEKMPVLLGLKPVSELAQRVEVYGDPANIHVLRRICVADTDAEAIALMREPLLWEERALHAIGGGSVADDEAIRAGLEGALCGSPATVARQLAGLRAIGIRHIIGWFHFGNMPYENVRRSMRAISAIARQGP
jgi:alkanesulfonate monooxygenase SsuD/methylene tetrahydromethanopterin reductase-like flavin-dependent oxidoreductase (luciferase family)